MINTVAIVGAGTMGSGIALAAALKDLPVILCDINDAVLSGAKSAIQKNLDFLVSRQKISIDQSERIQKNIRFSSSVSDCHADLVIEAIVEQLDVKRQLFTELASINASNTILASNTSSLSISAIQKDISNPWRVAGLHFFNPAHVMKLVEIVKGELTSENTIRALTDICVALDKTAVVCKDSPGFIVNRVARHYYLEAMKLVEKNLATIENVDAAMEAAGFKMGPFKLMDLIGMDVNLSVSTSLYEAFENAPRFKPSPLQVDKVKKGDLGRKSGKGFYLYNESK